MSDLVANPLNPREKIDVSDLASIAEIQLQSALVVDRVAFLKIFPELEAQLGTAKYVVINGCRRLEAAREYGRSTLECVIKNVVAATRATLRAASIRENVERDNLDVIEEANAVRDLVADCGGNGAAAGRTLGKSKMWVSQRLAILNLTAELQAKLRAGELAIREARALGRVPAEEQVARWRTQLEQKENDKAGEQPEPTKPTARPVDAVKMAKAFKKWGAGTETLASALYTHLDRTGVEDLIEQLKLISSNSQ
ncbi:ParB/RepB/Spo0J family partition protein [Nocardia tenerifensis]|uniref:ParB/RepB/Spo0J family partition protein n=1 Tax=Nocardia tenerifensis TaxID=228006 RepID=UPI0002E9794A|nr:ParB/RepB/Spo0J family partition protein [Nocardia tenerifensis]